MDCSLLFMFRPTAASCCTDGRHTGHGSGACFDSAAKDGGGPRMAHADETEAQARMWEIAENLHRAELTELERSEHVAEWISIAEQAAAEAEAARQKDGRVAGESCQSDTKLSKRGRKGEGRKKSGINQASRELIIPGKTDEARRLNAHRAVKVASLTPEAKQAAREVGLDDNRSALLAAAKAEPEKQAEVIRQIKAEGDARKEAAKAMRQQEPEPPHPVAALSRLIGKATDLPEWTAEHEAAFAALCDAWEAAPHEARLQFLQQLPSRYRAAAGKPSPMCSARSAAGSSAWTRHSLPASCTGCAAQSVATGARGW